MSRDESENDWAVQLLGEFECDVVVLNESECLLRPGEHLNLEREPNHPRNPAAIRVDNGRLEPVGYLPEGVCCWLAPLLDAERIRIDAHVPPRRDEAGRRGGAGAIVISVFGLGDIDDLLQKARASTHAERVHRAVWHAYVEAQQSCDPQSTFVANRLADRHAIDLLPETSLLLALLSGVRREIGAVRGLEAINRLHEIASQLIIGAPNLGCGATWFPLYWHCERKADYAVIDRDGESCAVSVEHQAKAGATGLRVENRSMSRVLVPAGYTHDHGGVCHCSAASVLISPGTTALIPIRVGVPGDAVADSPSFDSALEAYTLSEKRGASAVPGQAAGVLGVCGQRIVGLDVFDSAAAFRARLALRRETSQSLPDGPSPTDASCDSELARRLLASLVAKAKPRPLPVGLGDELEIHHEGLRGSAVLHRGRLCHLCAAPA